MSYQNEGLIKVTGCYKHRKSGNILETVQGRIIVTIDHWQEMIYGLSSRAISNHLEWLSRSRTCCKPFEIIIFV